MYLEPEVIQANREFECLFHLEQTVLIPNQLFPATPYPGTIFLQKYVVQKLVHRISHFVGAGIVIGNNCVRHIGLIDN